MGIIGGLFSQIVVCLYPKVAKVMTKHPVTVPCSIGIGIGLIGWLSSGETLGTGYVEAENMLMHGAEMEWYYAPLRLIATGLTLLSGIPGGLFDPSLSAGAGFGQWFANVMHNFEWSADIDPTVVMMIAMASFFAAVVQSPVTAVVIMVEMTGFVHGTMPMLFGSLIAYGISKRFCSCSIYVALAGYYFDENRCNEPRRAACID